MQEVRTDCLLPFLGNRAKVSINNDSANNRVTWLFSVCHMSAMGEGLLIPLLLECHTCAHSFSKHLLASY